MLDSESLSRAVDERLRATLPVHSSVDSLVQQLITARTKNPHPTLPLAPLALGGPDLLLRRPEYRSLAASASSPSAASLLPGPKSMMPRLTSAPNSYENLASLAEPSAARPVGKSSALGAGGGVESPSPLATPSPLPLAAEPSPIAGVPPKAPRATSRLGLVEGPPPSSPPVSPRDNSPPSSSSPLSDIACPQQQFTLLPGTDHALPRIANIKSGCADGMLLLSTTACFVARDHGPPSKRARC